MIDQAPFEFPDELLTGPMKSLASSVICDDLVLALVLNFIKTSLLWFTVNQDISKYIKITVK